MPSLLARADHRRRRERRPDHVTLHDLERFGAQRRREVDEVVLGEPLLLVRRRLRRMRLRGRRDLARHRRLRHGAFLDRPHGRARRAIEHEQETVLRDLRQRFDRATVDGDVDQDGRGRQVVVEQVVVHGLEMPDALAGLRVQRDDGAAVEVVAEPVAAVHVVRDAARRHVDEAELVVGAERRPDVAGARVPPRLRLPKWPSRDRPRAARGSTPSAPRPCARRTRARKPGGPSL